MFAPERERLPAVPAELSLNRIPASTYSRSGCDEQLAELVGPVEAL